MPDSCKEHTVTVLDELDRAGIPNAVLRSCTPWMRRCHVSAIAYVDGMALVIDNGALGYGREIPAQNVLVGHGRFSIYSGAWLRDKLASPAAEDGPEEKQNSPPS